MRKQVLIVIAMMGCCIAAFSQTDEKGIVLGVERSTAAAFSKHDLVFLNAVFTDDITVVNENGAIISKQQLLQTVQTINSVALSDMKARIEGVTAIVTGVETIAGKDSNGSAYSNTLRYTDILLKAKGQWLIITRQRTVIQ